MSLVVRGCNVCNVCAADYKAMSLVVRVRASAVPRPDGRADRDPVGGAVTPEITVSLEFVVIFQQVCLPLLRPFPTVTDG